MSKSEYEVLASPIEKSVQAQGSTPSGVWLDRADALTKGVHRCEAVFRMLPCEGEFTVLDVGCGPGLALGYLTERYGPMAQRYLGIDVSEPLVQEAKRRWPEHAFRVQDIVRQPLGEKYDYTVLNGVLTAKYTLPHATMELLATKLLSAAWSATSVALAFNVMSPHVDWTREDLFHWKTDCALEFCVRKLSRHVNVLADYGLYEYTVQVFRVPRAPGPLPRSWVALESEAG